MAVQKHRFTGVEIPLDQTNRWGLPELVYKAADRNGCQLTRFVLLDCFCDPGRHRLFRSTWPNVSWNDFADVVCNIVISAIKSNLPRGVFMNNSGKKDIERNLREAGAKMIALAIHKVLTEYEVTSGPAKVQYYPENAVYFETGNGHILRWLGATEELKVDFINGLGQPPGSHNFAKQLMWQLGLPEEALVPINPVPAD